MYLESDSFEGSVEEQLHKGEEWQECTRNNLDASD
jgi:hypothetical protein